MTTAAPPRSAARRGVRVLLWTLALAAMVALAAFAAGWLALRASLPMLEGDVRLDGLKAAVTVERDALGVPTIRAASRTDAARALGFLHAQDRFFQMDLLRRQPAGELAELFGERALESDRPLRRHRFRARAQRALGALEARDRELVNAYAEGVNAGVQTLDARPFEYLALRAKPAPWRPEDTFLVVYAMYLDLQDEEGRVDSNRGVLRDTMPPEMFAFLAPDGSEWDAAIDGSAVTMPPVPGPEIFDLRRQKGNVARASSPRETEIVGSNNFAVDAKVGGGRAMVAGDMHLGLSVPIVWYRASLRYADESGAQRQITGVTLPGTPFVVAGSNGSVAWAFTNSYGDWVDLVELGQVNMPWVVRETIAVKGAKPVVIEVEETNWGPIVDKDHRGRRRALRWVAHESRGVNANLAEMERAGSIDEAMAIANRSGMPAQNFVVADRAGRIGWTIIGAIPRRPAGWNGRVPVPEANGWKQWLDPSEYPRVIDPPEGRLWTANARVVGGEMLAKIGDGGYAPGARGRQIRNDLYERRIANEKDLLAIQLDDRAIFLARWQKLLLEVLSPQAVQGNAGRAELRKLAGQWGARAAVDSAGYRMVRAFRSYFEEDVYEALTAPALAADDRFRWRDLWQREPVLWALVTQRPAHLLSRRYASWDEQLLAAADRVLLELTKDERTLASRTWGERNTSRFRHPLASAIPVFGKSLQYPVRQLPGDADMPRVQSPTFGASQRMVVSPGRESEGIFHMPGGQSGHPLSPHFADSHQAWVDGRPTPFLPGATAVTLRLLPAS